MWSHLLRLPQNAQLHHFGTEFVDCFKRVWGLRSHPEEWSLNYWHGFFGVLGYVETTLAVCKFNGFLEHEHPVLRKCVWRTWRQLWKWYAGRSCYSVRECSWDTHWAFLNMISIRSALCISYIHIRECCVCLYMCIQHIYSYIVTIYLYLHCTRMYVYIYIFSIYAIYSNVKSILIVCQRNVLPRR